MSLESVRQAGLAIRKGGRPFCGADPDFAPFARTSDRRRQAATCYCFMSPQYFWVPLSQQPLFMHID
jgi:hypothetical protein